MGLTNEHVGPKILAKIKIYVLTRAELLFTLCYEIPCKSCDVVKKKSRIFKNSFKLYKLMNSIVLAHQKMLLWLARAERHFVFFMRASLLTDEYLVGIES